MTATDTIERCHRIEGRIAAFAIFGALGAMPEEQRSEIDGVVADVRWLLGEARKSAGLLAENAALRQRAETSAS